MNSTISQVEAVQIAKERAAEHPDFKNPHLDSARKQSDTGNWVIRFFSFDPQPDQDQPAKMGAMYQDIVVDKISGKILSTDIGGGS